MQMATNGNLMKQTKDFNVHPTTGRAGRLGRRGRGLKPVHEVDGAIDGVDDPGGTVGQLDTFSCSDGLLPDEPGGQRSNDSDTQQLTVTRFAPEGQLGSRRAREEPVLRVSDADGRDQDLLHELISLCHQIGRRTFQLHLFLLPSRRQDDLKNVRR